MKTNLQNVGRSATKKIFQILPPSKDIHQFTLTSPVPHLLKCNTPPSDAERSLILAALADTKRKLSALEKDGPRKQSSSHSQRSKRKLKVDYMKFVRLHESMLSPLRGLLPSDILAEIFLMAVFPGLHADSTSTPWALSQVCAEWRAVALDTPLLWNSFAVRLTRKQKTPTFLPFLSLLLDRSRQIPLDLTITISFMNLQSEDSDFQHPAIPLLVRHAERWRFLRLDMFTTMFKAFRAIKGRLHCLETLQLSFDHLSPKDDLDIFEVAPCLRKVAISGIMDSGESTLNLPCSQITTYRGNFSSAMSRDIVSKQSAALKHLHLYVHGKGAHLSSLELPPIRMENVTSFSMEFPSFISGLSPPISTEDFLSRLTMPSVEDIRLTNYCGRIDLALRPLVTHSQCHASLKKLAISLGGDQLA